MKNEFGRQLMHLGFGIFFIALIALLDRQTAFVSTLGIFITGVFVSIFHSKIAPIPLLKDLVMSAEREHEKKFFGLAALNFSLSVLICSAIFYFEPKSILIGALIVLSFGDSVSTIAGKTIGRTKFFGKSIEGTVAGIIAATLVLLAIFPTHLAIIAAIFGMAMEYVPLDDNFTIPIASGIILTFLI